MTTKSLCHICLALVPDDATEAHCARHALDSANTVAQKDERERLIAVLLKVADAKADAYGYDPAATDERKAADMLRADADLHERNRQLDAHNRELIEEGVAQAHLLSAARATIEILQSNLDAMCKNAERHLGEREVFRKSRDLLWETLGEIAEADWPDNSDTTGMYRVQKLAERKLKEHDALAHSTPAPVNEEKGE